MTDTQKSLEILGLFASVKNMQEFLSKNNCSEFFQEFL